MEKQKEKDLKKPRAPDGTKQSVENEGRLKHPERRKPVRVTGRMGTSFTALYPAGKADTLAVRLQHYGKNSKKRPSENIIAEGAESSDRLKASQRTSRRQAAQGVQSDFDSLEQTEAKDEKRVSRRQAAQIQRTLPRERLQQNGITDTAQSPKQERQRRRRYRTGLNQNNIKSAGATVSETGEREETGRIIFGTDRDEDAVDSRLKHCPASGLEATEKTASNAKRKRRKIVRDSKLEEQATEKSTEKLPEKLSEKSAVGRKSVESKTRLHSAESKTGLKSVESESETRLKLADSKIRLHQAESKAVRKSAESETEWVGTEPDEMLSRNHSKRRLRHEAEPDLIQMDEANESENGEGGRTSRQTGRRKTDPDMFSAQDASAFESEDAFYSHESGNAGSFKGDQKSGDSSESKKTYRRLYYESGASKIHYSDGQNGFSGEVAGKKEKRQRLRFDDGTSGMVIGAGMRPVKRAAAVAVGAASASVHGKIAEAEDDSISVEAAHQTEEAAEGALRMGSRRNRKKGAGKSRVRRGRAFGKQFDRTAETDKRDSSSGRLHFSDEKAGTKGAGDSQRQKEAEAEQEKKHRVLKSWQKKKYKRAYAAAAREKKQENQLIQITQNVMVKAVKAIKEAIVKKSVFLSVGGVFLVMFIIIAVSLSSCTALLEGGNNTFVSTTYPSDDADIYAVENAYVAMEAALQEQINSMESRNSGYDEYSYQIDEISHNPYYLISYFTAKYGQFTYEQVADELETIFQAQYGISMVSSSETVTETKTVSVGESLGEVVTSGYCSCSICCGQWAGSPTSSGVYPSANHTIAVDASNPIVPVGTKIIMNGVEYTVEDTGHLNAYGVDFDVYYDSHSEALAHGHQTWEAYLADDNGSQTIEVTTTETVSQLYVTVTGTSLDAVLRSLMDSDEEVRYDLYNYTYGNRSYLFDVDSLPLTEGSSYSASAEALSDEKFAKMYAEAIKYLGVPYVWGGYSPSGFDCSGFVSYVINNCGNGWNYGRLTAEGLRSICTYVSPSEAQPGDLIFFQGTYNTSGASHVGIYIGDGKMIHCGSPVQISNINTEYYTSHFLSFGRLP